VSLEGYHDQFVAVGEKLGDDDALSKYGAVLWSLERAPLVGLELAEEEQRLGIEGDIPAPLGCSDPELLQARRGSLNMNRGRFASESVLRYLHASGDLLGQLIRTTLLRHIDLTESCYAQGVLMAVKKEPRLAEVAQSFEAFLTSPAYRFAADASNRLKHRDWMPFRQWGRLVEDGGVTSGSGVGPFDHAGRLHDEADLPTLRGYAGTLAELGAATVAEILSAAGLV
jgi:hypothetical protein